MFAKVLCPMTMGLLSLRIPLPFQSLLREGWIKMSGLLSASRTASWLSFSLHISSWMSMQRYFHRSFSLWGRDFLVGEDG